MCVLGYCLFPLNLASLILAFTDSILPGFLKFIIVALAFCWCSAASIGFMSAMVPPTKKALAVFPVCLFYFFLSSFIVL